MKRNMAISMLVIIIGVINISIYNKQQHLKNGSTIFLELAPVDPRSLMQGDYMALRFTLAEKLYKALPKAPDAFNEENSIVAHDGKVVVHLDTQNIATYNAIYQGQTLRDNELTLNYRARDNKILFASNAFFFEEGTAETYESARYGEFKVNTKGELLLNAMLDELLALLTPDL